MLRRPRSGVSGYLTIATSFRESWAGVVGGRVHPCLFYLESLRILTDDFVVSMPSAQWFADCEWMDVLSTPYHLAAGVPREQLQSWVRLTLWSSSIAGKVTRPLDHFRALQGEEIEPPPACDWSVLAMAVELQEASGDALTDG
jgi:hypothetical protein